MTNLGGSNGTFASPHKPVPLSQPSRPAQQTPGEADEVVIAIMGATGSGKTTFINLISDSNLRVGQGLRSCTNAVQPSVPFKISGRSVTLIDTPGFDDTTKSDTDILKLIASFLQITYEHGKKLAGIIYMHRISDTRMGGISTRNFKMFRILCGEDTLKNVVIVTNMWGYVSLSIGEAREKELATDDMFFKSVLDKNARLVRHTNTIESARGILELVVRNEPEALKIQKELVDERMDITQTAAAEELNREMLEQTKRHRAELETLKEDMDIAIKDKDEETRKELERTSQELHEKMGKIQNDSSKLASEYKEEKQRMEKKMEEMLEKERCEREAAARKHEQQLKAIQEEAEAKEAASVRERHLLEQKMKDAAIQAEKIKQAEKAALDAKIRDMESEVQSVKDVSAAEQAVFVKELREASERRNQEAMEIHQQEMKRYQEQLAKSRESAEAERVRMQREIEDIRRQSEQNRQGGCIVM